ncbi:hypothetical protein [Deinococcus irradiatisoli]|nr:hypothetical protein [Deinococcus irradiatisoli]
MSEPRLPVFYDLEGRRLLRWSAALLGGVLLLTGGNQDTLPSVNLTAHL